MKSTYKIKDVVIVNFPFSDLSSVKRRPALVIGNIKGGNCILCQISSKKSKIDNYEVFLSKKEIVGTLKLDSYICVDMIFTLHKSQFIGKVGYVNAEIHRQVNFKLAEIFGIQTHEE